MIEIEIEMGVMGVMGVIGGGVGYFMRGMLLEKM